MGIINIGGEGKITVDGKAYDLDYKDALYIGRGAKEVSFEGADALFYINSANAHKTFPVKQVSMGDANIIELGALKTSNDRKINQLLISEIVKTCQLQMGMTELKEGSVWNTMPAHTHSRRMEAYFFLTYPKSRLFVILWESHKKLVIFG